MAGIAKRSSDWEAIIHRHPGQLFKAVIPNGFQP
jgi:hypothetical protein